MASTTRASQEMMRRPRLNARPSARTRPVSLVIGGRNWPSSRSSYSCCRRAAACERRSRSRCRSGSAPSRRVRSRADSRRCGPASPSNTAKPSPISVSQNDIVFAIGGAGNRRRGSPEGTPGPTSAGPRPDRRRHKRAARSSASRAPIHADTNDVSAYIDADARSTAQEDPGRRRARGGGRLRRMERPARGAPHHRLPEPADAGFEPEPRSVRPDGSDRLGERLAP